MNSNLTFTLRVIERAQQFGDGPEAVATAQKQAEGATAQIWRGQQKQRGEAMAAALARAMVLKAVWNPSRLLNLARDQGEVEARTGELLEGADMPPVVPLQLQVSDGVTAKQEIKLKK